MPSFPHVSQLRLDFFSRNSSDAKLERRNLSGLGAGDESAGAERFPPSTAASLVISQEPEPLEADAISCCLGKLNRGMQYILDVKEIEQNLI